LYEFHFDEKTDSETFLTVMICVSTLVRTPGPLETYLKLLLLIGAIIVRVSF